MSKNKPLILVTNDDGITAPGIRTLIAAMHEIGDVFVVAPDKAQSGMGHAITLHHPIRVTKYTTVENHVEYACTGTPVDCVKIAISNLMTHKPDLIVSGINHGSNSSIAVIYSGTMSAAVEGAIHHIPSIGFSLCNQSIEADFSAAKKYVKQIAQQVIKNGLPEDVCLNVNFPDLTEDLIKGVKVCRQARANWQKEFEERIDPSGKTYYWLTGTFHNFDDGEDTDEWSLANGYVTVVPVKTDFTAHASLPTLSPFLNS